MKQLDGQSFTDYEEPRTIQLLDNSINENKPDSDAEEQQKEKFDMKNLDSAIFEIESFITELDDKF